MSITTLIAIYGAVVSTLALINQFRSKRWRLIVTVNLGFHYKTPSIFARAVNLGERSIAIKDCYVQTVHGTRSQDWLRSLKLLLFRHYPLPDAFFYPGLIITSECEFPVVLEPGRACEMWLNADEIIRFIDTDKWNKLFVVFEDESERYYSSRPLTIRPTRLVD